MEVEQVAEMVETGAVAAKLRALGIDYAQGYHVSRPEPVEIISEISALAS